MSEPVKVRVQIHRFDKDRANWERSMLRHEGTGLDPVWQALEWANVQHERETSLITAYGMARIHEAYESAVKHGSDCTTILIGDRAYDVTFKKVEDDEPKTA